MASLTYSDDRARTRRPLRDLGARFGAWMESFMEAHARTGEIDALRDMSDAELARRGIARDQIIRHVYRDRFFF